MNYFSFSFEVRFIESLLYILTIFPTALYPLIYIDDLRDDVICNTAIYVEDSTLTVIKSVATARVGL